MSNERFGCRGRLIFEEIIKKDQLNGSESRQK
jgi:hypothetical protein